MAATLRPLLALTVCASLSSAASAQTVVDSIFTGQVSRSYSEPNNWSPPEIPNNTAEKSYNVTIRDSVDLDVDATIANLTLGGYFSAENQSLAVLGSTNAGARTIAITSTAPAGASFAAGKLSSFSAGVLTGDYEVRSYGPSAGWATLQFDGGDVKRLSNSTLRLSGTLTRIVDESGNNALRNLAYIDADADLEIRAQHFRNALPLTNAGQLAIASTQDHPATFHAAGGLTTFDEQTRTLTGGDYQIDAAYYSPTDAGQLAILQFPGADIVTNAASLTLLGPLAKISDESGRDALRNFAHNATGASAVFSTDFQSGGDFRNDGTLFVGRTFAINGSLQNFNPITGTLRGGTYYLNGGQLSFRGADIVRNAASLAISGGKITDENGANALRNFALNEPAGSFELRYDEFIPNGDFTNEGKITIQGVFAMRSGRRYLQTAGKTEVSAGGEFLGAMEIEGGELTGFSRFHEGPATIRSDLRVGAALLSPREINVRGSVTLGSESRYQVNRFTDSGQQMSADLVVNGLISLAGTIELPDPIWFTPASNESYVTIRSQQLTGAFTNAPNGARVATTSGRGSFIVSYANNEVIVSGYQRLPPAAQLLNISTRAHVGSGTKVAIAGFIIFGSEPKKVILRGIGPSLSEAGVAGALADPVLDLHGSRGELIGTNNDWKEDNQETDIRASGLAPRDDREAAIVATLAAGAYTVVLHGRDQADGVGLVEVYDLSDAGSKAANISTRGFVDSDNPLIAGFISGGSGEGSAELVVRAIGPGFSRTTISNFLSDPVLEVRDDHGELVAANDDYAEPNANLGMVGSELWPRADKDAAVAVTIPHGEYTAIVRGKNGAAGIALVEIYDLNR